MNQLNSFTSSSDHSSAHSAKAAGFVLASILIGLAMIDLAINVFLAYPSDPKIVDPSHLRLYFEYGRSTEGQLARMTRADPSATAPITLAGWYEPLKVDEFPSTPQDSIVTVYGMSHAVRLGRALLRVSRQFVPRIIGAPGAPANWSYGAFLRDRDVGKSRAVVLAFMSESLPMITTLSGMTRSFDLPEPYTSDRFYLDGNEMKVVNPPYDSFQQYVSTFYDPKKWSQALQVFAKYDTMYSYFMMHQNVLDHSALFRLVRRAYGQRLLREARRNVLDENGFNPDSEQVKVAQAIVHQFAQQARSRKLIPVIFIVNNLGFSDYLFQALRPALDADNVPYLNSASIVSPNDPRGYLPDSHFTSQNDEKLASALIKLIMQSK
jgi:hypothetical protein